MKRTLTVTIAALSLIALSACTRSNGGASQKPPQPSPQEAGAPTPNELDGDSGKSSTDDKSTAPTTGPRVPPPVPVGSSKKNRTAPSPTAPSTTAPVLPPTPRVNADPGTIYYDPTGLTPDQIFNHSSKQAPVAVGLQSNVENGQSSEPLYYVGSGQDTLRETLQTALDRGAGVIPGDRAFAKRVYGGHFDIDWTSRTAVVDVTINEANGPTAYRFSGSVDNRLYMHAGTKQLSIDTACMDLAGGCQTVYAKVQKLEGGRMRTAHMLIRQTEATLYTQADGFGVAKNVEFDRLLKVFVNTVHGAGQPASINHLMLRTSETINGQSGFRVDLGILNERGSQERLDLAGPLVKPANDIELEAPVQILRSTSPMSDTIRNISMIKNDGHGDLQLAITVRKGSAEASEDTMNVTIARIHKPARPLIVR